MTTRSTSAVRARVLLVDDDPDVHDVIGELLRPHHDLVSVQDVASAVQALDSGDPDLVLLDLDLGTGHDGFQVLEHARGIEPRVPVIILSMYQDTDTVVRAMKAGASHYIGKTPRYDELLERVRLALDDRRRAFQIESQRPAGGAVIVGRSREIASVRSLVGTAAASSLPVLILGETGTGKSLVARGIHASGDRSKGPYRDVNVAALAGSVLDSELFGHERGAFTGADRRRRGLFELASGGTILLDEIGDLPRESQVKLLRVVEDGAFRRVGSETEQRTDVRVLAATHQDLERLCATGIFRSDLYHRLAGIVIRIPALRERTEDIPDLVANFLGRNDAIDDRALQLLASHSWPGNVRELQQAVRRASLFARDEIIRADHLQILPPSHAGSISAPRDQPDLSRPYHDAVRHATESFQKTYLEALLARSDGNVSRAARDSGLSRTHLHELIRKLGIEPPRAKN